MDLLTDYTRRATQRWTYARWVLSGNSSQVLTAPDRFSTCRTDVRKLITEVSGLITKKIVFIENAGRCPISKNQRFSRGR